MRVNSINNTIKYNINVPSFKHTAVPYPEFENTYASSNKDNSNMFSSFFDKLFGKDVSDESEKLKKQIDYICKNGSEDKMKNTTKKLVAVYA